MTFAVVDEYPDEIVKVLIEAGADVNWKSTQGWTPLTYAVYRRNVEIVRLLIEGRDKHAFNGTITTGLKRIDARVTSEQVCNGQRF